MRRAPLLLALLLLMALLVGGLWWGLGLGSGSTRAAEREAELMEVQAGPELALSAQDSSAAREGAQAAVEASAPAELPAAAPSKPRAKGARVHGRVVDASGTGIAQVELYAASAPELLPMPLDLEREFWPLGMPRVLRTQSEADGTFEFRGLSHGELCVLARRSGYVYARISGELLAENYGEHALADLVLQPASRVEGRVVDGQGNPIAGARILRAVDGQDPREPVELAGYGPLLAQSDEQGRFVIDELPSGAWHVLAHASGYLVQAAQGSALERDTLLLRLERGISLRGSVQVEAGAKLAEGATVWAWPASKDQEQDPDATEPASQRQGPESLQARGVRAAVDAQLQFELSGLLADTLYSLELWAPDDRGVLLPMPGASSARARSGERNVQIQVSMPLETVGRVVDDASGAAIENFVLIYGAPGRERALNDAEGRPRRHFPNGEFRIPQLRVQRNRPPRIVVRAAGYIEGLIPEVSTKLKGRTELAELRLKPAAAVRVRVVALEDESPIEDARVYLARQDAKPALQASLDAPELSSHEAMSAFEFQRTDEQGWAQLSMRTDGPMLLAAVARGRVACEPVALASSVGAAQEFTLKLGRGGRVEVRVQDSQGRPVAGIGIVRRQLANTTAADDWSELSAERKSDARGEAVFLALPRGVHQFRAQEGGGSAWVENGSVEGSKGWMSADVVEGSQSQVVLTVLPRATLMGRVREGRSQLAGATIRALAVAPDDRREEGTWQRPSSTQSDAQGQYRLEGLSVGTYRVMVMHPARALPWITLVNLNGGEQVLDVDLPQCSVAGRVLDTEGRGIEGVYVSMQAQDPRFEDVEDERRVVRIEQGRVSQRDQDMTRNQVRTRADGRFEFSGLPTEVPLMLHGYHEQYERLELAVAPLTIDEARSGIEVRLARAARIEVLLTRTNPVPHPAWLIVSFHRLRSDGSEELRAEEWIQDRTVAEQLPPGRYRVSFMTQERQPIPGLAAQEVELTEGEMKKLSVQHP